MVKVVLIPVLLILFSYCVIGQEPDKKVKILPVPTIGYSPETKTYIGAVTLFTFDLYKDSVTRTSNAKLEFTYTWNKQLILETEWNYFFREEKWFTKGRIHYSGYPDYYYGVGANTPESNKLLFESNRFMAEASVLKKVGGQFFLGPGFKYISYGNIRYDGSQVYPELTAQSTFGLGLTLLKDTRNNLLTPEKGLYLNFNAGYNFSTQNYGESSIDIRFYKTWVHKYTWANRMIHEFNFGTPPFYDYAFLGGDKYVRGYSYGRYRDNHLSVVQTEFRFPVIGRWGMATFGGLSNLYHEKNFSFNQTKLNYGAGIRFMVDKHDKTNLRLDYAIGDSGNNGFYISFGESF